MAGKYNVFSQDDCYLFGHGTHYQIYEKMGAHPMEINGIKGVYFAVWAPHATYVNVIGEFNNWDRFEGAMSPIDESGIFEAFIPEALGRSTKMANVPRIRPG